MKRLIGILLTVSIFIFSSCPYTARAEGVPRETELYSLSAALIDGDSGRVLYDKNGYDVRAMASTTKIMTLILALEYGNMEDLVTVSSYAAKMPDVQLGICEGEQYYLGDLIYSMMLESHNDSAVAIAEHIGGDVEHFSKMMNDKAAELGLSDTYYITPNGLDAKDEKGKHSTTAVELALVMKYCVMDSPAREQFLAVCQTRSHSFSEYKGKRHFSVSNKNRFLDMMDGVLAGKTGFTADAGYCYVAAVSRDGKTYIIALLGCGWPGNKNYKWSDAKRLFNYGIEEYAVRKILSCEYETGNIEIENGIERQYIGTELRDEISLLVSDRDEVELVKKLPNRMEAPVQRDEIVGTVDVLVNNELYATVNIYATDSVERINLQYYMKLVLESFLF